MFKRAWPLLLVAVFTGPAGAAVLLSEGFDDIAALPGAGWAFQNNSAPLGLTDWFQGNDAVFPAQAGAATAYIGANFNNTSGGTGTISNWMLTPVLSLANGDQLSFFTRTADDSIWPDRLEVRLSTGGGSSNVGSSATDVGDFSTLLPDGLVAVHGNAQRPRRRRNRPHRVPLLRDECRPVWRQFELHRDRHGFLHQRGNGGARTRHRRPARPRSGRSGCHAPAQAVVGKAWRRRPLLGGAVWFLPSGPARVNSRRPGRMS